MEDKSMLRIKSLLLLLAMGLAVQVPVASAAVTYAVGTCLPHLHSYSTIGDALAAVPASSVVKVCPATYNEQVVITIPVTLEGVTSGNSAQAIIAVPTGGLVENATAEGGGVPLAVQVFVNNVTGPVNLTNLTIDATGASFACAANIVGVFYQNSSGTVNRVTTRNQKGGGCGFGIWAEGGSANPTVTVENSTVHDFDDLGIVAETNATSSELTTTIKGNDVNGSAGTEAIGISAEEGSTDSVVGNAVTACFRGIINYGASGGSISGNSVTNSQIGIIGGAAGMPVTANKILNTSGDGIYVASTALFQGNTITGAYIGIELGCVVTSNVHNNTISDAVIGVDGVPGTVPINTYFNVGTVSTGGC
jgi:hypothetical protein